MAVKKFGAMIERIATTATAAGTTTLVFNSPTHQQFTGVTTQTVVLPDATTGPKGLKFVILNRSTGIVTVNYNGGSLATTVAAGSQKTLRVVDNATSAGTWDITNEASGGGAGTITTSQRLGSMAALSNENYQDSNLVSKKVVFNPEEVLASVTVTKASLLQSTVQPGAFSVHGYGYVAGGNNSSSTPLLNNQRYADDENYWLARGALTSGIRIQTCGAAFNGFGYVMGGSDGNGTHTNSSVDQYNDATDTWSAKAAMNTTKRSSAAFVLTAGMVSCSGLNAADTFQTLAEMYNDSTNAWQLRVSMPVAIRDGVNWALEDKGYVTGGDQPNGTIHTENQMYDHALNSWTLKAAMPTGKSDTASFAVNGCGYTSGGLNSGGSQTSTGQSYNGAYDVWLSNVAGLSANRVDHVGFDLHGLGYSCSGVSGAGFLTSVEQYRNFSYANLGMLTESSSTPASVFVATALSNLLASVPVQVSTDGDSWRTFTSNQNSALRLNETVSSKFIPSGLPYLVGGTGPIGTVEFFDDIQNTVVTRQALTTTRQAPASFQLAGLGYAFNGGQSSGGDNSSSALSSTEQYSDVLNTWVSKASTPSIRIFNTGFAVSGFGYAVGGNANGDNGYTPLALNDQYNDAANTWTAKTAPTTSVTLLMQSNFVLGDLGFVLGGFTGAGRSQVTQIYNAVSNTWTSGGSLAGLTSQSSAMGIEGFGYRATGFVGADSSSSERYNMSTSSWTLRTSANNSRRGAAATKLGGNLFISGGLVSATAQTVNEKYIPGADVWSTRTALNTAQGNVVGVLPGFYRKYQVRVGMPAALAGFGGATWITSSALPTAKASSFSFNLNERLYNATGNTGSLTNETLVLDLVSGVWVNKIVLSDQKRGVLGLSLSGFGYAVGGLNGSNVRVATNERYDDSASAWSTKTSKTTAVQAPGGFTLNGNLYGVGGQNTTPTIIATTEQYNPTTDAWTSKTSLPVVKFDCVGVSLGGLGYIAGGYGTGSAQSDTYYYNDASNAWSSNVASLNTARGSTANWTDNASIYGAGGTNAGNSPSAISERFNIAANAWISIQSLASVRQQMPGAFIDGSGYVMGGDTTGSSVFTSDVQKYSTSISNLVLGLGLRIS